jgi:hypothetical protein
MIMLSFSHVLHEANQKADGFTKQSATTSCDFVA